jgi:hypothetical protein
MFTQGYDGLVEQLKNNDYRNMLYGIYNLIDDENYINKISAMGYDTDINSLEFTIFNTTNIKNDTVKSFKEEVERENKAVGIFVVNGKKRSLIAVKPKAILF